MGDGRWVKGRSGNPGGRQRGNLAKEIRRQTRGGKELVELALEIARESSEAAGDRLAALKLLMEYTFQKPAEAREITSTVTATVETQPDLSALSFEELTQLEVLMSKASGVLPAPPPALPAGVVVESTAVVVQPEPEPVAATELPASQGQGEAEPVEAESVPEPEPVAYEKSAKCIDLKKRAAERRRRANDPRFDEH